MKKGQDRGLQMEILPETEQIIKNIEPAVRQTECKCLIFGYMNYVCP